MAYAAAGYVEKPSQSHISETMRVKANVLLYPNLEYI